MKFLLVVFFPWYLAGDPHVVGGFESAEQCSQELVRYYGDLHAKMLGYGINPLGTGAMCLNRDSLR